MASIAQNRKRLLNSESAQLDIDLLLAHVLGKSRSYLYGFSETELSPEQQQYFENLLQQRNSGQPVAYLLGQQEFWSLPLKVTPDVLIPRADTETLIELVLAELNVDEPLIGADLGTGSGAIALALASEAQPWHLLALDYSSKALAVAQANAKQLGLQSQLGFIQSNWGASLANNSFDFIVSNPPYIDPADALLTTTDIQYEPRTALCADDYGLADLSCICQQTYGLLKPGGHLWLEHGFEQGTAVQELLHNAGFIKPQTHLDLAKQPRISYGQRPHHEENAHAR